VAITAQAGDTSAARVWLTDHDGEGVLGGWYPHAYILVHLGEVDSAFALLQQAMDIVGVVNRLPSDPHWDPLRGDSRFDSLRRRMNLEGEYYEDGTHSCRDAEAR